jgi:hypothetical protein
VFPRKAAAAAVLILGLFRCGPTEPRSPKQDGGTPDATGTLTVRARLPDAALFPGQAGNAPDSALCELVRGSGPVASRMLVLQPDRRYSGTFTDLVPAEDYAASVFVRSGDGVTTAFGDCAGICVEAGKSAVDTVGLKVFRPNLISPADASVTDDDSPTFRWNPLRGAGEYRLQAAADSGFQSLFFSCEGLTVCEYTHGSAFPPGDVWWRVAAGDRKGAAGLWSQVRRFSVGGGTGTFVIRGLGVRFGPWDPVTNRAGDFLFLRGRTRLFWDFGLKVGDGTGGFKELPDFGYNIPADVWVTAVADGRIVRAVYQEDTRDWEFTAVSTADPDIQVGYDHLVEPRIGEGDTVAPGDTLGRPGPWDGTLGRVEVNVHDAAAGVFRCPMLYLDPAVADSLTGLIRRHMADWETFTGDTAVFNQEEQTRPGCRVESIPVY